MSKYTPGPWRIVFDEYGGYDSMSSAYEIHDSDDKDLAVLDTHKDGESKQHEANARLIASAPELLEALKTLLAGVVWDSDKDVPIIEWCTRSDEIKAARAAVAKAENGLCLCGNPAIINGAWCPDCFPSTGR